MLLFGSLSPCRIAKLDYSSLYVAVDLQFAEARELEAREAVQHAQRVVVHAQLDQTVLQLHGEGEGGQRAQQVVAQRQAAQLRFRVNSQSGEDLFDNRTWQTNTIVKQKTKKTKVIERD